MIDGQTVLIWILLGFLVTCAIAAMVTRNLLTTVLIFMSYSLVMTIIWVVLESPDLAGTEAAVGAGVTSILFFVTLKKIKAVEAFEINAVSDEGKEDKNG